MESGDTRIAQFRSKETNLEPSIPKRMAAKKHDSYSVELENFFLQPLLASLNLMFHVTDSGLIKEQVRRTRRNSP